MKNGSLRVSHDPAKEQNAHVPLASELGLVLPEESLFFLMLAVTDEKTQGGEGGHLDPRLRRGDEVVVPAGAVQHSQKESGRIARKVRRVAVSTLPADAPRPKRDEVGGGLCLLGCICRVSRIGTTAPSHRRGAGAGRRGSSQAPASQARCAGHARSPGKPQPQPMTCARTQAGSSWRGRPSSARPRAPTARAASRHRHPTHRRASRSHRPQPCAASAKWPRRHPCPRLRRRSQLTEVRPRAHGRPLAVCLR